MGPEVVNKNKNCVFNGPYASRDLYVTMFQESEREFVVTHNADIKPVSYFTGRETELEDLRRRIEDGRKSVLVSGMGGIGKTHICRKLFEEYLNRHTRDGNGPFRHIGYIEYNGDMGSSLQNCLKFKQQDDPGQNQEAAWRELEYLAADGKLLLFVDNVNVPAREDAGLERLKQIPGAVVLTSRRTSFGKEFELYRIDFLSTEQCIMVYEKIRYENSSKKVPEEEISDLEYIIEEMAAGHTITIEFLAHLAETKCWTVKRLREELDSKGFRLEYKNEEDKLINIQEEYEKLYDLSVLTEAERNILEAFSVFPYIPLEAETCNQWLLADAGVGEEDDVLVGLYRKGWLQFDMEQKSYSMHPVFAQFIYERCKPRVEKHHGLIKECEMSVLDNVTNKCFVYQKYIPFAGSICEKIVENNGEEMFFIYIIAILMCNMAEYKYAEILRKKLLAIYKNVFGENDPGIIVYYNDLGELYMSQEEYEKAEKTYIESLRISEDIYGQNHEETAYCCSALAEAYMNQGKYVEAEELYERSLMICENKYGVDHINMVYYYSELAKMYERQKKYKKAEKLFVQSLKIIKRNRKYDYKNIVNCYNNLAKPFIEQGKFSKAEEILKHSLCIIERELGENNKEITICYNNLAYMYENRKEYKNALEYSFRTYRISDHLYGGRNYHTDILYQNMKTIYCKCGLEDNFEQWLEEKMKE